MGGDQSPAAPNGQEKSNPGADLLSLLLKKLPVQQGGTVQVERSRTPPVQPTVAKEETSRPLTPPANLPRRKPNSREVRNEVRDHRRERNHGGLETGEQAHKSVNELGIEEKEGVAAESQQVPVAARWRLQRVSDERAPQNKPKGPDGTRGFAAGRGKPLAADPGRSILGEPLKEPAQPVGAASRPQSSGGERENRHRSGHQRNQSDGDQQKNLDLQLKIAQFIVAQEMKAGTKKEDSSQRGAFENGSSMDEEAPFAPPPSRQGSRKGQSSPAESVNGEKPDISQPSIDELSPTIIPEISQSGPKKEEEQVDLARLTQVLENAFAAHRSSAVSGVELVARAADEWLETDLAAARDKVSAVLEKSIRTPAYAELVDLEKHLKATMAELRRFRTFVESEGSQPSAEKVSEVEKLEGKVRMLRYELGAAQAEVGRLEAELAFERMDGGSKPGPEGGSQLERELERVRLELRAWQGEVENLKGALERSEESRQEALMKLQSKEAESFHLQQEKEVMRASAQTAEKALKDALEERAGWKAQLDAAHSEVEQLRLRSASELEEIGRLRAKSVADAEESERLKEQVAAARVGASQLNYGSGNMQEGYGGVDLHQRYQGGAQDILSQLFPKGQADQGARSAMTWQQQDLTRQQEPQYAPGPGDRPSGGQLTWQQQEMTRQQEPHRGPHLQRGGQFGVHMRPPVLHETDLAFAHFAQQRHLQGIHFQNETVSRYPRPNMPPVWDAPAMTRVSASRGLHSHYGQQTHHGQQRLGPFPADPQHAFWQQPLGPDQPTPSIARTASAVEQEMLGRSRSSFAMPIPVSVLLAAGKNTPKQGHTLAGQPATSAALGLIDDDEIIFKGR